MGMPPRAHVKRAAARVTGRRLHRRVSRRIAPPRYHRSVPSACRARASLTCCTARRARAPRDPNQPTADRRARVMCRWCPGERARRPSFYAAVRHRAPQALAPVEAHLPWVTIAAAAAAAAVAAAAWRPRSCARRHRLPSHRPRTARSARRRATRAAALPRCYPCTGRGARPRRSRRRWRGAAAARACLRLSAGSWRHGRSCARRGRSGARRNRVSWSPGSSLLVSDSSCCVARWTRGIL